MLSFPSLIERALIVLLVAIIVGVVLYVRRRQNVRKGGTNSIATVGTVGTEGSSEYVSYGDTYA